MKTLLTITLLCVSLAADAASYITPNATYIDGSTNVVLANGTNQPVDVVYANTTLQFNMPNGPVNTNLFPAVPLLPLANLQPNRYVSVYHDFNCTGTNNQSIQYVYAVSPDLTHWQSNYTAYSVTCNGTTRVVTNTLIDTGGFPYCALQAITNNNPTVSITNHIFIPVGKPRW